MTPAARFIVLASLGLGACASGPPSRLDDLCAIFDEKPRWYRDAQATAGRWKVPVALQMAFLHQESKFEADAKPARKRLLWVIPWRRPSSAYGFAQVLDETWNRYKRESGNRGADRDDFDDAVDFIGWYVALSQRTLGIPRTDPYRQYLAYHEGQGGYARGSFESKPWLKKVARRVERRARIYQRQLDRCAGQLQRGRGGWRF